jgi:glycosyltransferase involved in cell wall biosynthesis
MKNITFISAMEGSPWGASEELWCGAARYIARKQTVQVFTRKWEVEARQISELEKEGCNVIRYRFPLLRRGLRRLWGISLEDWYVSMHRPSFAVISQGGNEDGLPWMEACLRLRVPYVAMAHAAKAALWPSDEQALKLQRAYAGATRAFFVSRSNQQLTEDQLGCTLANAELVWNPCKVPVDFEAPWPSAPFRIAVVGRLAPDAKSCDVILHALSRVQWGETKPQVSFYGDGPNRRTIRQLKEQLHLDHVVFEGHSPDILKIWEQNHLLLLPSRYEGRPVAVVEAMQCSRPCLVTYGSGGDEILEHEKTGFICPAPTVPLLTEALENAWRQRSRWQAMGQGAASAIRSLLPKDPCREFAHKLFNIFGEKHD